MCTQPSLTGGLLLHLKGDISTLGVQYNDSSGNGRNAVNIG